MMPASFPSLLKDLDQGRRRAYADHLAFYQGDQWPDRPRSRSERRLTLNYTETVLTAVAGLLSDHLRIRVTAPLERPESAARAANLLWQETARSNGLATLDFETELDAAILGDACYKVTWDEAAGQVRVTSPDIQGLFAWWQPDDPNSLTQVAQQYRLPAASVPSGGTAPLAAGAPGGGSSLITERWTETEFDLWVDDALTVSGPNPYGFIPHVIFPNVRNPKQFWGQSDIPRIRDVQQELNRELSTLSMVMQLSGNPIAVLENVERADDISVEPGAVWEIPEHSRAYVLDLLERGGARLHVEYVQLLYRALHDLAQTPRSAFGDLGRSISGVAMELDMAPLTRQVRRKRLSREAAYRRRTELALRLLQDRGRLDRGPYAVEVAWGDILPSDPQEEARRLVELAGAGLKARTTAMAELGERDPAEEWARVRREAAQWEHRTGGAP